MANQSHNHNQDHGHGDDHGGHFIVPLSYYHRTIGALLVLTVLTVAVSYTSFGSTAANLAVAMAIALVKALLVTMIFMGLRWDSWMNRVSMIGTVAALAVFIWLTSADKFYRIPESPMPVKKAAAVFGMEEVKKWEADTSAEKLNRGKELYANNCSSCHGVMGQGDGPAGAALNPRPRNFHSGPGEWKNGSSVRAIYITLAEGIKGSGMAAFTALSAEDRFALVHFIRSMADQKQAVGKADGRFAEVLEKIDGVGANAVAKETIPVDIAIDLMVKEQQR